MDLEDDYFCKSSISVLRPRPSSRLSAYTLHAAQLGSLKKKEIENIKLLSCKTEYKHDFGDL